MRPLCRRLVSGRRIAVRAALLAIALAAPPIAAHVPLAGVQAGDIERVRLVLGSSVIYRALPFDEPFYLTGRVDPRIDSVAVRIVEADGEAPACAASGQAAARSGVWRRAEGFGPDSFYVRIDELPPNRRYDLCVTARSSPAADRLERLRAGWRAAIDSAFRKRPGAWTPDGPVLRGFQDDLRARIGPDVAPAPGSLLDRRTTADGMAEGLPALVALSAAQAERALALEDVEAAADRAAPRLEAVRREPALVSLVALRSATSGAPRTLAAANRDEVGTAAALLAATGPGVDRIARGDAAAGEGVAPRPRQAAPAGAWTVEDIEPRLRNLEETTERLADLLISVRSLGAGAGPPEDAGTTSGDLARLDRALQDAVDALAAVTNRLSALAEALAIRSRALDEAVAGLIAHERMTLAVEAHTHYDVETGARNHVAADFGAIYLPDLGTLTPVLGANFYLRPVNRDRGPGGHLLRRLAINIGVTTTSLRREGLREDLFGSLNLAVGAGLRLTRLLRVSGGAVLLRGPDDDSGGGDPRLRITPFVGVTLDFVVKDALSGLFGEIF